MAGKLKKILRPATLPARLLLWTGGVVLALILVVFIAAFFIDEPLRRTMEKGMNEALDGYSVTLRKVDFNPLNFSVTLYGLVIRQDAHPETPVAVFPETEVSVHWREIFSGHLVAGWRMERPEIYVNLLQLKKENEDEVPVEERGWQEAVKSIYPLELNRVTINGGRFTYIDKDPERPLRLSSVNFRATNIRNIHSPENDYPSPFRLEANIFEKGHGVVDGNADFLAEPHVGLRASLNVREVPLEKLAPVASKANLHVDGGILSGRGNLEFAPKVKNYHLADLEIKGLRLDYVHTAQTAAAEKERARKTKKASKKAAEEAQTSFLIDRLFLSGEAGMVNEAADPPYRIFLSDAELILTDLSSEFRRGPAEAKLKGLFMGSGATAAKAVFRPEKKGANLDLRVRIEGTRVKSMNDLLRAYGKFDVVSGSFSLYTEIDVRGKQVTGYVKPFFQDLDVYDPEQDKEKGILQKIYEAVVGGVGQLLENPKEKVATRADISGTLDNPEASTWQIIVQLIKNAFFKAILPGFERQGAGGEG
jgi:uncharacterized protein involved in outer membrane biogenesis